LSAAEPCAGCYISINTKQVESGRQKNLTAFPHRLSYPASPGHFGLEIIRNKMTAKRLYTGGVSHPDVAGTIRKDKEI
tara:strand:- start:548 stop:781 length:234 start_codon:yes stop_codon:yes gene_type:complete